MFLFSKNQSVIGLDIGTAYIKAVQLKKGSDKPFLESYGIVNVIYPHDATVKFDPIKETGEILQSLYEKARFTTKRVVLSLPSNVAFVSVLNMPPMSEKELQKSVEYQAKKYIPLPVADVNLGWQILEDKSQTALKPAKPDEAAQLKILLTAVPKNVVNNYLKVIEYAGFEAVALEIESLSLIRSLVPAGEEQGILLVDVGAKSTVLSLVHGGYLWVSRHLSVGGDTITSSVARSMGVSFERAEQMKRTVVSGDDTSPAFVIGKNVVEMIRSEVQQVIRIADNQGKKVGKIVFTGGGSKLPNFFNQFAGLAQKIEAGNPLAAISSSMSSEKLQELAPQLAVAVGLALRQS